VDLLVDTESIDPTLTLADDRRVRVVELVVRQGELILRCETTLGQNLTGQ
jgi:hypothetical protein